MIVIFLRLQKYSGKIFGCIFFMYLTINLYSQEVIRLTNPSFEDIPGHSRPPIGWRDCGAFLFPGESPPDVQPSGSWEVRKPANNGDTYLGMVVRENDTWESVSQQLSGTLKKGKTYTFDLFLCTSEVYMSFTKANRSTESNYTTPAKLRIWGGNSLCSKEVLLAESSLITNNNWKKYYFTFKPTKNVNYIVLEAFYKTSTLVPYNGNILVDNASNIVEVIKESPVTVKELTQKVTPGQIIKLDQLYFKADNSSLDKNSHKVLNEVVDFMQRNEAVKIEIGGHTNGVPSVEYCQKLSSARAREVANYIINKGIDKNRVTYKGYGKSKPIASDRTPEGRKKNQRVEIKLLST